MLVPVRDSYGSKSGISAAALRELNTDQEKEVAIKEAMTYWERIKDFFFHGIHAEAFGCLYDVIKAKNAFNKSNAADDRITHKNKIDDSFLKLNELLGTPHDGIYSLKVDQDTGDMSFDIAPGATSGSITKITQFENNYFFTAGAKDCWNKCKHCFSGPNGVKAMEELNKMTAPGTLPVEQVRCFAEFVKLADMSHRSNFGICIENADTCVAKLIFRFNQIDLPGKSSALLETPMYSDEIADVRDVLWSCPGNLVSANLNSSNPAAKMLNDLNYQQYFSEQGRPGAKEILEKLRRDGGLCNADHEALCILANNVTIFEFIAMFPAAKKSLSGARAMSISIIDYLSETLAGYDILQKMAINDDEDVREKEVATLAAQIDSIFEREGATDEQRELVGNDIAIYIERNESQNFSDQRQNILKILLG